MGHGHATLLNNKLDSAKEQFILIEQLEEHVEICIEINQSFKEISIR